MGFIRGIKTDDVEIHKLKRNVLSNGAVPRNAMENV